MAAAPSGKPGETVAALSAFDTSGVLRRNDIVRRALGPSDIQVAIHYSGVCHSDLHQVRGEWDQDVYYEGGMTPGHEGAGVVEAVGSDVTQFRVGDHVGIGVFVDSCRSCDQCKAGTEQYCSGPDGTDGLHLTYNKKIGCAPKIINSEEGELLHGTYSEKLVIDEKYAVAIPDSIPLERAGPLLCAGITTYSPLNFFGAKAGGKGFNVGIVGFGGLGHMGAKFSVAMGNNVFVISRSQKKREAVERLGATFINSTVEAEMEAAGATLDLIINTVSANTPMSAYFDLLKPSGVMVLVGLPPRPIPVKPFDIVGRRLALAGSSIGGIAETKEMMAFAAKHKVIPDVELIDAKDINHAMAKLSKNANPVNRYVIKIADTLRATADVEGDSSIDPSEWEVLAKVKPESADIHAAAARKASLVRNVGIGAALVAAAAGVAFLLRK